VCITVAHGGSSVPQAGNGAFIFLNNGIFCPPVERAGLDVVTKSKTLVPAGTRTPVVQPVASQSVQAHLHMNIKLISIKQSKNVIAL
jgi:hypothetical protein